MVYHFLTSFYSSMVYATLSNTAMKGDCEVAIDHRHLTGPTKASASLRAIKRYSEWSSIEAAPPCSDCIDLNTLPTIWPKCTL